MVVSLNVLHNLVKFASVLVFLTYLITVVHDCCFLFYFQLLAAC